MGALGQLQLGSCEDSGMKALRQATDGPVYDVHDAPGEGRGRIGRLRATNSAAQGGAGQASAPLGSHLLPALSQAVEPAQRVNTHLRAKQGVSEC